MNAVTTTPPTRFAAPAPADPDEDDDAAADQAAAGEKESESSHLHELCCQWAAWTASRRLYVRPSAPQSVLGKLTARAPGKPSSGGPDAIASAQLMAFHHAVLAQPPEALDRQVFELHYLTRVRNIKTAAALLGISRQHWYTLLRDFRQRAHRASLEIMGSNLAAAAAMPSQLQAIAARDASTYTTPAGHASEKVSSPQMTN